MKSFACVVLTLQLTVAALLAQVSVTTSRNNNNRDGQNLNETILTPANVNVKSFGKLFSQAVDGYVYAQPLYVPDVSIPGLGTHNVVFIATEHDSVYAFDADSNSGVNATPLWHRSFINPTKGVTTVASKDVNCDDIVPEIGATSTPVIDTSTGTMYVLARTKENAQFVQRLHALNITTGKERSGSPVVIRARVKGNGAGSINGYVSFNPFTQAQRPGLLLQNNTVYIGWASACDNGPFHGWVMSYNATTLKQTAVWNSTPNGGLGGIWQSGTGLAADSSFNIFLATGNGTYDGQTGRLDFGDSVVKLAPGPISVSDWFTPYNQRDLSRKDIDVGSGGILLLPDQSGPHRHLLIQVGKSGDIYLINRDHMGHYNTSKNNIVQDLENAVGGMWATPAWWNNNVYFGGSHDYFKQYIFDPNAGLLSTSAVYTSPTYVNFPGPIPSISANGTSDAIVWLVQTDSHGAGSAILHAYDATNISIELYNSKQKSPRDDPDVAVKFTVPTIANGKVYVASVKGLSVYGLLDNVQDCSSPRSSTWTILPLTNWQEPGGASSVGAQLLSCP
jgi:hypothetical protein